jgi:hypothetical protein
MPRSPFWGKPRWEAEAPHLYYLDHAEIDELESPTNHYIIGTRGTGKTTLLKSLDPKERNTNEYLRRCLPAGPFNSRILGVYTKLPLLKIGMLDDWLAACVPTNSEIEGEAFSLYLDLRFLEKAAVAVNYLRTENIIHFSAALEQEVVSRIVNESGVVGLASRDLRLVHLADLSLQVRDRFEALVQEGLEVVEALRTISTRPRSSGYFGRVWAKQLVALLQAGGGRGWIFKYALDEAEQLFPWQQTALNTMVRHAESPLFYTAAYADLDRDLQETDKPGLELGRADVEMLVLDLFDEDREIQQSNQAKFDRKALGVIGLRLEYDADEREAAFEYTPESLRDVLGSYSVNDLLVSHIRDSDRATARQLLDIDVRIADLEAARRERGQALPIYESYLVRMLNLHPPDFGFDDWRRFDNQLREKQIAAYLRICRQYGWTPRYAGLSTLLQLSDFSVRDVMWQMHELWLVSGASTSNEFLHGSLSIEAQSRAYRAASLKKKGFASTHLQSSPAQTVNIISGLMELSAQLQSSGRGLSSLKLPERGIFVVSNFAELSDSDRTSLGASLAEAGKYGYIRFYVRRPSEMRFRLHRSLAAAAGISHRRPSYDFRVAASYLLRLGRCESEEQMMKTVLQLSDAAPEQGSLTFNSSRGAGT